MSIFSHNIFENTRTRVIVLHKGAVLLFPPEELGEGWRLPGGGLQPDESLAECAAREVFEETGLVVGVAGVAFLREWVVPKYCPQPAEPGQSGFGLEVYFYATPENGRLEPRAERSGAVCAQWVPLAEVPHLPLWPKELKALARALLGGATPRGVPSFTSQLESPWAEPDAISFL